MADLLVDKPVSPITGLTDTPKAQTVAKSKEERIQDILQSYVPGGPDVGRIDIDIHEYTPYLGHVNILADIEEARAQQQSIGQQLAYGTGRLVGTTATKLLEGLGYAATAVPALLSGDADIMLDNAFSQTVNNVESWMKEEAMPIYHTNKYKQGNVLEQMGTLGFWMDDVVDGAAFMISNLIGAKGVSVVGKGLGGYGKLAKAYSQTSRAIKTGKVAGQGAVNLTKLVNTMDMATMSLYNSVTEAAFEAKDIKDSLMKQGLGNAEASQAAMNTFWSNVAILMGPNMITNSMVFKPFKPKKGVLTSLFKDGKFVKEELKELSFGDVAGVFAKKAAISTASEGLWEENIQLAIQNYETSLALGEEDRGRIRGLAQEWVNNFTTDEGQKSMVLGAIIGLIPGGVGGVREAKAERKQMQVKQQMMGRTLEAYQNQLNDFLVKDDEGNVFLDPKTRRPQLDEIQIANMFKANLISMSNLANSVVAMEAGNETMFEFLREQRFGSLASSFFTDPDGLEHFKNQIDVYARQEIETLERVGNYEMTEDVNELKAKYEQKADQYKDMYDAIVNNYTAFTDFGDSIRDQKLKAELVGDMFMEAVNQNFWVEKKAEVEAEIAKVETSNLGRAESKLAEAETKRLNKELEGINKIIQNSESKFRELSSPEYHDRIRKDRTRFAEDLEGGEFIEEYPVSDSEGKEMAYEGKEDLIHVFRDENGELEKLTDEQVKERGIKDLSGNYVVEPDILLDEEGYEYILDGKEGDYYRLKDIETGQEGLVTVDELKKFKFRGEEISTVEEEIVKKHKERMAKLGENYELVKKILGTKEGEHVKAELDKILAKELGTSKYDNYKLFDIFNEEAGVTGSVPSVYRGEVGDLFRRGDKIIFKAIGSDTTVEFDLKSKLTMGDLGISVYKNFVYDMELVGDGRSMIINGVELRNNFRTPLKAIVTDRDGNPIAVRLWKGNKRVLIKNPTIAADLAVAIPMIEEVRRSVLDYMKESREGFVWVKDPKSKYGKEYKVHNVNGEWIVEQGNTGKPAKDDIAARVLDNFFQSLADRINLFNDYIDEQNALNNKITREDIQNELREYDDIIRQATPREINESKPTSEIPNTEADSEKEVQLPDEQEIKEGEKVEESINDDKAKEIAEKRTDDQIAAEAKKGELEDESAIEPVNDSEIPEKDQTYKEDAKKYLKDPSNTIAYDYTKMPEFDEWISNRENTLDTHEAHFSIAYDVNDFVKGWWSKNQTLKNKIQEGGELTKDEIDNIPIAVELRDKSGNVVPGGPLFMHTTGFVPKGYTKDFKKQLDAQQSKLRKNRATILEMIMKGDKPIITKVGKTHGHPNNTAENKLLSDVFPIKSSDLKLGVANNKGYIMRGDNTDMRGKGNPGNVFIETKNTANGEVYPLKLNVSKLTDEHAKILLNALVQAYSVTDGYNSMYRGDGVENLTNREVIRRLVLEGKKYTKQTERTEPKNFLIPKQLWVENRIIHYGENGMFNIKEYTQEDVRAFVKWAKTHKNYVVERKEFGKPLKKNFRIGRLIGTKGELYDSFVVKHGLVKTDLDAKMPFRSPVVTLDYTSLTKAGDVKEPISNVKQEPIATVPGGERQRITRMFNAGNQFADLPVGTVIFNKVVTFDKDDNREEEKIEYFTVVEKDGKKKLALTSSNPVHIKMYKIFHNTPVDNIAKLEELLVEFEYGEPLTAIFEKTTAPIKKAGPKKEIDPAAELGLLRIKPMDVEAYEPIDVKRELAWLKKRLPKEQVELVDDLIKVGDELAYGQLTRDAIILSKAAEVGTLYHEAFHRVSMGLLSDKQRQSLYADARKKYSKIADKTDKVVEEHLAERFREYVMAKDKPAVEEKLGDKIKSVFKKIWDFLRYLFVRPSKLSEIEVEKVFEMIELGKFKHTKLNYDNEYYSSSEGYLKNALGLSSKRISTIVKNLAYLGFSVNKVNTLEDIKKIDFDPVFEKLEDLHKKLVENEQEPLASRYGMVIENREYFEDLIDSYLQSLKISKIEDPLVDEYERGNAKSDFERHGKSSYESNFKDNMLSSIKMLVMTLQDSTDRDPYLNLFMFADFNSTWNRIMSDMHNAETITEMLDILSARGQDDIVYQNLRNKLVNGPEMLRTQFEVSVKKAKHKFLDLTYKTVNDKPIFQFQNTDTQRASRRFVKEWSENFYASDFFVKDKLQANKVKEVQDLHDEITNRVKRQFDKNGKVEDLGIAKADTIKLLNQIGIPVDNKVLNYILAIKEKGTEDEALKDFLIKDIAQLFGPDSVMARRLKGTVKNTRGDKIEDNELLTDEKAVEQIASAYMISKPEEMSVTVLGPAGNPYFIYSANNYVTDTIRKFKRNPDEIKKLLETVNASNSFILKQLYNDPQKLEDFDIKTFSGFIEKGVGDTGRDYLNLNKAEDFLFKLAAIHAGYSSNNPTKGFLPMPTLADRKTYYLYSGMDLLNYEMNVVDGKAKLPSDSEVIDVFLGYAQDEKKRIDEVKEQIKTAMITKDSSNLVENFHYKLMSDKKFKASKGKQSKYQRIDKDLVKVFTDGDGNYLGEGAKFQHFAVFDSEGYNNQKSKIAKALDNLVDDTIEYAAELGILEVIKDKNGRPLPSKNILLDNSLVEKIAEDEFGGNQKLAMKKIIANFTVNNIISDIETEKMLSGDIAFYKNVEDKIKRLTVLTSTGDNLRTGFPEGHYLHNETEYNVTTLETSATRYFHLDELIKKYTEVLKKESIEEGKEVSDEDIKKRVKFNKLFKYGDVDQTDAQVYISPTMYKSLHERLGEWTDSKQRALELLESDVQLTAKEEKRAMDLVMPPSKFVHYGMYTRDNLAVPIFDKMSLAPLFKRLVKDTNLEELYNRMELKGKYSNAGLSPLHMVKFDTAVKVGNTERVNYYTDKDVTQVKDFLNNPLPVQTQKFEYLRRQLITEPHDVNVTLFGTQVKKLGISNVIKDATYIVDGKKVTGQELTDQWTDILKNLSNNGKKVLLDKLGIDVTKDGYKIVDASKLMKLLREDAKKAGMPDNIVDALKVDESGEMYMTIDSLPERKWIYSRFISLVNKHTVDLELPGNAFIQMTNFGLDKMSDENIDQLRDDIEWVDDDGEVRKRPLKFYELNEQGGVNPMECMVSVSLFKKVIPDYKNLTWSEKKAWIKKHPEILGYRIPTQGLNSISHLKVVGILPEQLGDTIILPAEFTALTGSDFDIDKLYVARYSYDENGEKIQYVDGEANSKEAMSNRLLDIYKSVLTNPDHLTQVITPLDAATDLIKNVYKDIQKITGEDVKVHPSLFTSAPRYQAGVKDKYTGGKGGIGPFALGNAHHVLGQIVKLALKRDIGVGNTIKYSELTEDSKENFLNWITMDDKVPLDEQEEINLTSLKFTDLSGIKDVNGEYILDWMSALINAHVDIAKDPYIFALNVNQRTYSIVNMLVRAGVGEDAFYFLPQPILTDLSEEAALQRGRIRSKIGNPGSIVKKRWQALFEKAIAEEGGETVEDYSATDPIWDKERLRKDISTSTPRDAKFYARQLQIYEEFQKLDRQANFLNDVVMSSRIDTKQYGSNLSEIVGFLNRFKKMERENALLNVDALFEDTFLDVLKNNSVLLAKQLFSKLTVTGSKAFQEVSDRIITLTGNEYTIDNKYINFVADELFSALASRFFVRELGADKAKVSRLFFGENNIVQQVARVKAGELHPEIQDNRLIQLLKPEFDVDLGQPAKMHLHSTNIKEKWDRDDLVRSWEDLLEHDNEKIRKLGTNIVMYAFYSSGFNKTMTSFFDFIPNRWLKEIGYADHMRNVLESLDTDDGRMILNKALEEVFVNNWSRTKSTNRFNTKDMVPRLESSDLIHGVKPGDAPRRTLLQVIYDNESDFYMGTNEKGEPIYSPYVLDPSGFLYKYVGYEKENKNGVYKIVPVKKGYYDRGFVIKEYFLDGSIIDSNIFKIDDKYMKDTDAILAGEPYSGKAEKYRNVELLNSEELVVHTRKGVPKETSSSESPEGLAEFTSEQRFKRFEEQLEGFVSDPANYTNHSGGAIGADTAWDEIGREYGMTDNKHYYFEGYKTPKGNAPISIELKNEADSKLIAANKTLGRRFPTSKEYVNNLLRRNWWQVKNSDAIFAISTITSNKVDGGTGWAVHMGIAENKPVYVFDQNKNKWFTWGSGKFAETITPVLTPNFAGIGTREINADGRQAIRDAYEKTFTEPSPFLSDEEIFKSGVDVIMSTEATPEELERLRDKYKNCKLR